MHSVERSPEPEFLARMRADNTGWDDLDGGDRHRIRDALARDFSHICAYCEQACQPTRPRVQTEGVEEPPRPVEESVDHFRPRSRFPELWLDWSNLVYACYRCNQSKSDSWPVVDDMKNRLLTAALKPRFTPVSAYVNPNASVAQRPAQEFFNFDADSGEIMPAAHLDDMEWSTARRTIDDLDLNDEVSEQGAYHPDSLVNQRRYRLYLLIEQMIADPSLGDQFIQRAASPGMPFSSYIAACFTARLGGLP